MFASRFRVVALVILFLSLTLYISVIYLNVVPTTVEPTPVQFPVDRKESTLVRLPTFPPPLPLRANPSRRPIPPPDSIPNAPPPPAPPDEPLLYLTAYDKANRPLRINDRLSGGVDNKLLADLHIGTRHPVPEWGKPLLAAKKFDLSKVYPGVSIFVDSADVPNFVIDVFPKISVPFILFTGDGDDAHPMNHVDNILLAEGTKVIRWFSQNCLNYNWSGYNINVSRFECMPIGLSQWPEAHQRTSMQAVYESGLSHFSYPHEKKHVIIASANPASHKERAKDLDVICKVKHTWCFYDKSLAITALYERYAASKFVFSPRGNGPDCFRTWEILYLGSFPVVKKSNIDILYEDLPVLIVDNLAMLSNLTFIEEEYEKMDRKVKNNEYNWNKIYFSYYIQKVREIRMKLGFSPTPSPTPIPTPLPTPPVVTVPLSAPTVIVANETEA